jgi:hypothetical protein
MNRAAQWERYKFAYGMEMKEGFVEDQGTIVRTKAILYQAGMPFEVKEYGVFFRYGQYLEQWDAITAPENGIPITLDNEDTFRVTKQDVLEMLQVCQTYCIRLMQVHELRMKVNQTGSGGKGGLMINYPH